MAVPIVMPRLGMTMKEGTVIEWRVTVGDAVTKGEVVLIIESEKAEAEIEAPADGVVRHVYVEPETTVPSGTLLAALTETGEEPFDAEGFEQDYVATEAAARGLSGGGNAAGLGVPAAAGGKMSRENVAAGTRDSGGVSVPAAGAEDHGALPGDASAARARAWPAATAAATDSTPTKVRVTPAARKRARALNVDPTSVVGTGPGGRITREDVERMAESLARRVEVAPGVSLEVFRDGKAGDPVVLLPGLGTDVSVFAQVVPSLSERFRVLAVNGRGVGLSDAPEAAAYDVTTAARDVEAVVGEPLHVVGASLGAAVAIELALRRPTFVRSLVLITPFVTASGRLAAVTDAWSRLAAEVSAETLAAAIVPWMFSSRFLADSARRARAIRGVAQTGGRIAAATVARQAAGLWAWAGSRRDDLAGIDVPTLVIAAGEDLLVGDAREVAEGIPRAEVVVVEQAGHAVSVEAPEAVSKTILAHLETA